MKKLFFILLILLISANISSECYAFDVTLSTELDATVGSSFQAPHYSPDIQLNLGQSFDIYRIYTNIEHTNESSSFPNSTDNYRIGLENNYFSWVKLDTGFGFYKSSTFVYGKMSFTYDSDKNER